jgi:hypothetical protein
MHLPALSAALVRRVGTAPPVEPSEELRLQMVQHVNTMMQVRNIGHLEQMRRLP